MEIPSPGVLLQTKVQSTPVDGDGGLHRGRLHFHTPVSSSSSWGCHQHCQRFLKPLGDLLGNEARGVFVLCWLRGL